MLSVIKNYLPSHWERHSSDDKIPLSNYTEEFTTVRGEVEKALRQTKTVSTIARVQNVYAFGQMYMREQLLIHSNPSTTYYRVRRFVTISRSQLETALKYNLDYRRCGKSSAISFSTTISVGYDDVVLALLVVTKTPNQETITPDNFLEYCIEYVIQFS